IAAKPRGLGAGMLGSAMAVVRGESRRATPSRRSMGSALRRRLGVEPSSYRVAIDCSTEELACVLLPWWRCPVRAGRVERPLLRARCQLSECPESPEHVALP